MPSEPFSADPEIGGLRRSDHTAPSQRSVGLCSAEHSRDTMQLTPLEPAVEREPTDEDRRAALSGTSIALTLQSPRQLKEACMSFLSSLPRSCLTFLALAMLASFANCMHGITLIAVGQSCLAESDLGAEQQRLSNANFIFYGTSQLLLGMLICVFAVNCLMHENWVEMAAAVVLDGITCLFDISLLANKAVGKGGALLPAGCSLFTDLRVRVPFLVCMLLLLAAMLCAGVTGKKEFGWRIFKLCGTKVTNYTALQAPFGWVHPLRPRHEGRARTCRICARAV